MLQTVFVMTSETAPECCRTVHFWKGTPTGSEITVGSLKAYLAKSPSSTACILFIHDAFGWTLVNSRLFADQLASLTGCDVVLPEYVCGRVNDAFLLFSFYNGEGLPTSLGDIMSERPTSFMNRIKANVKFVASIPSAIALFSKHNAKSTCPKMDAVVQELKKTYPKIGSLGFCWGGKYAAWLAAGDKVDCFAAAHPSSLEPSDLVIKNIPGLICVAKGDSMFPNSIRKIVVKNLKEKVELVEYDGLVHGFAIRGRDDEEVVIKAREDVMQRFGGFFKKYLAK